MAKIYANLIKQGLWKIEQVSERWNAEVQEILNSKSVL